MVCEVGGPRILFLSDQGTLEPRVSAFLRIPPLRPRKFKLRSERFLQMEQPPAKYRGDPCCVLRESGFGFREKSPRHEPSQPDPSCVAKGS